MVIFPRSKINIGLRIIGKRPDGYHNLQTILYPVCLCDAIEFIVPKERINEDMLNATGIQTGENSTGNLVFKALKKLRESAMFPFLKVHLHKAIPVGAGLGGGSSDAAGIIKSVNRHFNLGLNDDELKKMSLELGSDCPFFIDNNPAYAEGRGELLTPVRILSDNLYLLLVNPGIHVNTKEAYGFCKPEKPDTNLLDIYNLDIETWKDLVINDFERPVFRIFPLIADLKERLYEMGAIYSSMSGSGSTVYGLFRMKPEIPADIKNKVIYSGEL